MKTSAALLVLILLASTHSLNLPSIRHYLLSHMNPEVLAALDLASQNITDEPVVEIADITEPSTTLANDEIDELEKGNVAAHFNRKEITIESSEASQSSNIHADTSSEEMDDSKRKTKDEGNEDKDAEEKDQTNNTEDKTETDNNEDSDETEKTSVAESVDTEVKIKIPLNGLEETPRLPSMTHLKPESGEILSTFSQPKPHKLAPGSGIKTVYVQATKTVRQQPMCITVNGLKPPCGTSDNPGYKTLDSKDVTHGDQIQDEETWPNTNKSTAEKSEAEKSSDETASHESSGTLKTFEGSDETSGEEDDDEVSSEMRALLSLPQETVKHSTITSDEYSDDINEDEHSNAALYGSSNQRQGKHFKLMKSFARLSDRIFPHKAKPHQVVTQTIYSTKVLPQQGETATLVVENCVPINSHIPFCGNIYPIYSVSDVPPNYFHVPIPVLHEKFPLDYKPNYLPLLSPFNWFPRKPLLDMNPQVPYEQEYIPQVPHKANEQNFPPTSNLGGHVPGFIKKIANLRLAVTSAAQDRLDHVGYLASQASKNAAHLTSSVHSHLNGLHQHKMQFLGNIRNKLKLPQSDISAVNEVKPVKEDVNDLLTPTANVNKFFKTTSENSDSKSLEPNTTTISNTAIISDTKIAALTDEIKSLEPTEETAKLESNEISTAIAANTNNGNLNDAIGKQLNEITTVPSNITNPLTTTGQVIEKITSSQA